MFKCKRKYVLINSIVSNYLVLIRKKNFVFNVYCRNIGFIIFLMERYKLGNFVS